MKTESDMIPFFICTLLTILALPIEIILSPIELISLIIYKITFRGESEGKQ